MDERDTRHYDLVTAIRLNVLQKMCVMYIDYLTSEVVTMEIWNLLCINNF